MAWPVVISLQQVEEGHRAVRMVLPGVSSAPATSAARWLTWEQYSWDRHAGVSPGEWDKVERRLELMVFLRGIVVMLW